MNDHEALAQLKDIHLPPPVGWWPPAPGWWLLLLVGLAVLAGGGWWLKRHRKQAYRRAARLELRRLLENPRGLSDRQRLAEVAALLRRVAIQSCGRARVAPLSGAAWLAFLDRSGRSDQFSTGSGRALGSDLYRPEPTVDLEGLFSLVEEWIRRHRSC